MQLIWLIITVINWASVDILELVWYEKKGSNMAHGVYYFLQAVNRVCKKTIKNAIIIFRIKGRI